VVFSEGLYVRQQGCSGMRGFRSTGESCVDVLDFGTWSFSSLTWTHPQF